MGISRNTLGHLTHSNTAKQGHKRCQKKNNKLNNFYFIHNNNNISNNNISNKWALVEIHTGISPTEIQKSKVIKDAKKRTTN